MSRGKGKKKDFKQTSPVKGFLNVPPGDFSEDQDHLTPAPVGMRSEKAIGSIGGTPVYESVDVPVGQWVDIPRGMTAVPGCYIDDSGVMRFILNNAPAVWHHPSGCKYHQPPCKRRVTNPAEIVYDDHNAPWCPDCAGWGLEDVEFKKRDEKAGIQGHSLQGMTLDEAVGDFDEADDEEFGAQRRVKLTEADIKKLDAASYNADPTKGIYSGFRGPRPQKFYPSGAPRKW